MGTHRVIYKFLAFLTLFLVLVFPPSLLYAQEPISFLPKDSVNTKRLRTVITTNSSIYAGGLLFLNNLWYRDHEAVPFHFYNDLNGWIQMDKAGHMYAAYYESYFSIRSLLWAGVNRRKAVWIGGAMGVLMQAPIEVFDGLYEGYGFSVSDMVANTAGSALVVGQELLWDKQRIRMKFSYRATKYPKYRPSAFGGSPVGYLFTDYNGQTYWLSANISDFFPHSNMPRWLNLAFGYGADGMLAEFQNPERYRGELLPEFDRRRQLYLSLDINLSAIPTRNRFLKTIFRSLNILKVPAPTLEYNSSGKWYFHPLFF